LILAIQNQKIFGIPKISFILKSLGIPRLLRIKVCWGIPKPLKN